jgi:hypothetical protein
MDFLTSLEQSGIGAWVNQSSSTFFGYPGILLIHTIGMTLVAGTSLVIGLRVIGFAPQVPLTEIRKLFPFFWIGFGLSSLSGVLLLIAKATTMVFNPAFYVKMLAIAIAITTLLRMQRSRLMAAACIGFWLVAITAGRMMAYLGEAEHFGLLLLK